MRFLPMSMPRRIELLVFPDAQVLDATGPAQVFASANDVSGASARQPLYDMALVGEATEVISSSGITLRRVFLRRLGVGPKDWQERFQA